MTQTNCRVLVTGANGFIGKNLLVRLGELPGYTSIQFVRGDNPDTLPNLVAQADAVVHLAGENRPVDESAFETVNAGLTEALCNAIQGETNSTGRRIPLILASSTQAERDNPYGRSKLAAEQAVYRLAESTGNPVVVFRLPGVFGKWCKPNYNSVVATFCHNIARGLPIQINDPTASLKLVYVDDVVDALLCAADAPAPARPLFNVVDTSRITQQDYLARCRRKLGDEIKVVRVPRWMFMLLGFGVEQLGKVLRRDVPLTRYRVRSLRPLANFDTTAARADLGWTPRTGVEKGLDATFG